MLPATFFTSVNRSIVSSRVRSIAPMVAPAIFSCRHITHSAALLKAKKKHSNHHELVDEAPEVVNPKQILKEIEDKFKLTLQEHQKKINEIKLGKSNPKIFDSLKVSIAKDLQPFPSVAQTTTKGRNLLVTVFDPSLVKHVVSSILSSGLNLNPEIDPKNPQLLKVPLTAPSAETKKETLKALKNNLEHYRHSITNRHSLASIRAHYLKEFKGNKEDSIKKLVNEIEKVHKDYSNSIHEQFKKVEKTL
ncbi:BA75_03050T0 [Komagataella pastoris]|uniref:Ribosome-recycling factor, mitochondrial n=1 Tax=Komagataella pastoris TaxID=4922 RepID=A0A1B2JEN8_PICPA|nr:BA75_03050T0 [Komagataella pastoris]